MSKEKKDKLDRMSNAIINLHFHTKRLYKICEYLLEHESHKEISDKIKKNSKEIDEECVEILKKISMELK